MARRNPGGGILGKALWSLVILSLIWAWVKTPVKDTDNFWEHMQAKSAAMEVWVTDLVDEGGFDVLTFINGVDPDGQMYQVGEDIVDGFSGAMTNQGGGTALGDSVKKEGALKSLDKVEIAEPASVAYDRDEWKHWSNAGSSCWTVREEVLHRDAVKGSIKMTDKDGKATDNKSEACAVTGGKWIDFYTGKTLTDPSAIDIDHMVPLSYAARHGGQEWSPTKKKNYANNLKNPMHLVAVSASANRSKGDKGPDAWKPSDRSAWCGYAAAWTSVSTSWDLSTTKADAKALKAMLATCSS